jgi:hypothetical protein
MVVFGVADLACDLGTGACAHGLRIVFVAFESRPPGGVPSDGALEQHQKNAPAGFGGLPGASMASDEIVVGFDRRGDVTKLRLTSI